MTDGLAVPGIGPEQPLWSQPKPRLVPHFTEKRQDKIS